MLKTDSMSVATRQQCAVCASSQLEAVIDLPNLPLTGRYSATPMTVSPQGFDQKLLFCHSCRHSQAAVQLSPQVLYDDQNVFRTSESATARKGTDFFLRVLNGIVGTAQFKFILDLGCNDLYLLRQLKDRAQLCVGVDPIWQGRESEVNEGSIKVRGDFIENINFQKDFKGSPDLIVCRHTLEHIYNVREVLEKLFSAASDDTLFLFEVPGFDGLLNRLRFDQVFHQHLQYFSLQSFRHLIAEMSGTYVGHWFNYHDWGAMCIAFKKGKSQQAPAQVSSIEVKAIKDRYAIFKSQMEATCEVLNLFKDQEMYGYGAAQMLPTLAYHLKSDLSFLRSVLDDDPNRDGMYYQNLPLRIANARTVQDLSKVNVFITAVDNVWPIMNRLLPCRPRHIIYPLHII